MNHPLLNGCILSVENNEAGGRTYTSDEIGGGVHVWDTALVNQATLLTAISIENKLNNTIEATPLADHLFTFGVDTNIVEAVRLIEVQNPMLIAVNRDCIDHYGALRNEFAIALAALEKLAKLGNGDQYGNSDGNVIAIQALERLKK